MIPIRLDWRLFFRRKSDVMNINVVLKIEMYSWDFNECNMIRFTPSGKLQLLLTPYA